MWVTSSDEGALEMMQKAKECISPDYRALTEEEIIKGGLPVLSDSIENALRWVDMYSYHSEHELGWELLACAAELAGSSLPCWGYIAAAAVDFGWTEKARQVLEKVDMIIAGQQTNVFLKP